MNWNKRDDLLTVSDVVCRNMNIPDIDQLKAWETKSERGEYRIDALDDACRLIDEYKDKHIWICGDYDADGRNAAAILYLGLVYYGCKNIIVKIPKRFSDGYGMKPEMIDCIEHPDTLIITVDNGIAAVDAVKRAKELGMKVIVTDHHPGNTDSDNVLIRPDADVVIDPKAIQGSADFDGYCGAGVAYRLVCALVKNKNFTDSLIPYVAIATIADIMDLREENRVLVKRGLSMMSARNAAPGILALMDGMDIQTCDATAVGFKMAPAINATGRIEDHDTVTLQMLCAKTIERGRVLAEQVIQNNSLRKKLVVKGVAEAEEILGKEERNDDDIIIVALKDTVAGIAGIVAGKLSEAYGVPAIVFSAAQNGVLHGSARSVEGFNISGFIDRYSSLFKTNGGHEQAAGVSVYECVFPKMKETLTEAFRDEGFVYIPPEDAFYDLEIEADEVMDVLKELDKYEPYGKGNEKPVFKIKNFRLVDYPKQIAGNGVRLKSASVTAVGFGLWPLLSCDENEIASYDLYGTLSWNEFRGRKNAQIELIDLKKHDRKQTTSFAASLKRI